MGGCKALKLFHGLVLVLVVLFDNLLHVIIDSNASLDATCIWAWPRDKTIVNHSMLLIQINDGIIDVFLELKEHFTLVLTKVHHLCISGHGESIVWNEKRLLFLRITGDGRHAFGNLSLYFLLFLLFEFFLHLFTTDVINFFVFSKKKTKTLTWILKDNFLWTRLRQLERFKVGDHHEIRVAALKHDHVNQSIDCWMLSNQDSVGFPDQNFRVLPRFLFDVNCMVKLNLTIGLAHCVQ